jgi:hypothetical protein
MVLTEILDPLLVIVDGPANRVYATANGAIKTIFFSLIESETTFCKVAPQTTKIICPWAIMDQAAWITDEEPYFYPSKLRSTENVVGHFLDNGATHILIDQDSGVMTCVTYAGGLSAALEAVSAVGDTWAFELVESSPTRLVFE